MTLNYTSSVEDSMDGPSKNHNRSNRFFLPKIAYSRLENNSKLTTESNESNVRIDLYGCTAEESSVGEEHQNKRSVMGLEEKQTNERPSPGFTKFSVLPPIRDHGTSRGKYYRQLDKTQSDEKHEELDFRKRGSLLHRQPAFFLAGERGDGATQINTGNLQIVGQRYTENSQQPIFVSKTESEPFIARRPSSTPHASNLGSRSNLGREKYSRLGTKEVLLHTKRFPKFKRFNSEESSQVNNPNYASNSSLVPSNENISLLRPTDIKKKVSAAGLSVDGTPNRPVSRCHIDINVNDTEIAESDKLSSVPGKNISQDTLEQDSKRSNSAQITQISDEDTNNNNRSTPSIQILIDTLETAKNEIPEKLELPKMSVREQRRRSALCRVNSKQVDDFLLVHNLKDLGLL